MASQPPPLNEMEEISKTIPFKYFMYPQETAEMPRQHDLQTKLHPNLPQSFDMMKPDDNYNHLHGKDSQSIAEMPSRLSANLYKQRIDAMVTSNMMKLSQQARKVNERLHTPSQSSERTLKEMVDLPQSLINFHQLRTSTSFSKFNDDKIQERYKAPMMLAPGEIPQSSNNFKKACIAHLPNKMDLNEEAHTIINQEASDEPSCSSANSDPQQEILRDIQKYHPIKLIGGNYTSIELNKELLHVDTISVDEPKLQVPQYKQEYSDMMWLQSAWSRVTEALSVGKVWRGMNSEQKDAFDRAIIYRAQHKELDSSSLRLQIDKFTNRILFVIEGMQAPVCSPTIADLKNILRGAQSFNTLSHQKCNFLMVAQRHHHKNDLTDSLESETLRSASENVRSIPSTRADTSNHREEDSSWKHSNDEEQSVAENFPVKKFNLLEMAIRNPLPCWNHPIFVNGKPYQRVKSPTIFKYFNHFGFSDENLLGQMTKSLEQMSILSPFPVFAGSPQWLKDYFILNGQVCQRLIHGTNSNLLPLVSWNLPPKAPLPMVPINRYKSLESDRQSTDSSPQETKMTSKSLDREQMSSSPSPLGLESPQYPRAPIVSSARLSPEGQRMMVEARQKALESKILLTGRDNLEEEKKVDDSRVHTINTPTTADNSTYVDATRVEIIANVDRAKESDRTRALFTEHNMTNAASDDFSFVALFQEKLDALKTIDQKYQDQKAPLIQGTNIDLNSGDAISQEASRASERKWYLERKAYFETLRERRRDSEQNKPIEIHQNRERDVRSGDATCLDHRYSKDYRHSTSSVFNETREAKDEFQASIADAYSSYCAARKAKDDACMKLETAVAERKALWMGNIHKLDNPRFKKECSDADKKFLECHMEHNTKVDTFNAIKHVSQQKYKDREAFEKRIELINRSCGDDLTQKTELANNDSVYATFAADHHSTRVTLARLDAYYTAQSAKPKVQPLRTIDYAWTDAHYGFLEQPIRDQKQRNSISSNNYITVEEHAQDNFQPCLSHPDKVLTHIFSSELKAGISSKPAAVTGQCPNPGSRKDYSVKSTDRAEYMTMVKEWKTKTSHSDIMKAMILARAARGRQLAGRQPERFDHATFRHLRHWGYSRPEISIDTASSTALASSALDLLAVERQGQSAAELVDKEVAVSNNAKNSFTETSKAANITASTMNRQIFMADKIVTDVIDITKILTDLDIATANKPIAIAERNVVEATKIDVITTTQQTINNEVNSISETTANAEAANIDSLFLSEPFISDTETSEIPSKDLMRKSLVLDFPSAPPPTPVPASSPKQELDLEYDSDLQSDASWAMTGDDDFDVVAEASGLKELESSEESEDVDEWEIL